MTGIEITPGQVWEHRHGCRACPESGNPKRPTRHRYLIMRVVDQDLVTVRDIDHDDIPHGAVYPRPTDVFGSLEKGGLRLAGHLVANRFKPLPAEQLDERVVDHPRIPPRKLRVRILPRSEAA